MFIGFANFHQYFILGFGKIARLLTLMFKTTTIDNKIDEIGGRNCRNKSNASDALVEDCSSLTKFKNYPYLTKSKSLTKSNYIAGGLNFLTLNAKAVFTKLSQTFIKALTICHFWLDCYICIETDTLGYAIEEVLNQLIMETSK